MSMMLPSRVLLSTFCKTATPYKICHCCFLVDFIVLYIPFLLDFLLPKSRVFNPFKTASLAGLQGNILCRNVVRDRDTWFRFQFVSNGKMKKARWSSKKA